MQCVRVSLGKQSDGLEAKFVASADHANRYLAPIGHKYTGERSKLHGLGG
jgi:hypothetical protein